MIENNHYYNIKKRSSEFIPDGWSADLQEKQRAILEAAGYVQVPPYERQESDDFEYKQMSVHYNRFTKKIEVRYTPYPLLRHLDRDKVISEITRLGKLEEFSQVISSNPLYAKWWIDEHTYLRGSPTAEAIAEAIGVTQAELEAIVQACV